MLCVEAFGAGSEGVRALFFPEVLPELGPESAILAVLFLEVFEFPTGDCGDAAPFGFAFPVRFRFTGVLGTRSARQHLFNFPRISFINQ